MNIPTWVKTGAAVTVAALLGSRAARPDGDWYRNLDKRSWQPPRQAFPAVWTVLYGLLAYAGARAVNATPPGKRSGLRLSYATNLGDSTPAGPRYSSLPASQAPHWPSSPR